MKIKFYMNSSSFAGVLDGQGHTITFEKRRLAVLWEICQQVL